MNVFAANVDAAWIGGEEALAVVVRDSKGELILVAAKNTKAETAEHAEMKAVN